jgi:hypothetical protein
MFIRLGKRAGAAEWLLHAKNKAQRQSTINIQIVRPYLMVGEPTSQPGGFHHFFFHRISPGNTSS